MPQLSSSLSVDGSLPELLLHSCAGVLDAKLQQLEHDIAHRLISDENLCALLKDADDLIRTKVGNYLAVCIRSCDYSLSFSEVWHDIDYDQQAALITDLTKSFNPNIYLVLHAIELNNIELPCARDNKGSNGDQEKDPTLLSQLCATAESCNKLMDLFLRTSDQWHDYRSVIRYLTAKHPDYLIPWAEQLIDCGAMSRAEAVSLVQNFGRTVSSCSFYMSEPQSKRLSTLSERARDPEYGYVDETRLSFKRDIEYQTLIANGRDAQAEHLSRNFSFTKSLFEASPALAKFIKELAWYSIPIFSKIDKLHLSKPELKSLIQSARVSDDQITGDPFLKNAECLATHGYSRIAYQELADEFTETSSLAVVTFIQQRENIANWLGGKRTEKLERILIASSPDIYALGLLHTLENNQIKSVGQFLLAQQLLLDYPLSYADAMPRLWQLALKQTADKDTIQYLKEGLRAQGELAYLADPTVLFNEKFVKLQFSHLEYEVVITSAIATSTNQKFLTNAFNRAAQLPMDCITTMRRRLYEVGDVMDIALSLDLDNPVITQSEHFQLAMQQAHLHGLSVFKNRVRLLGAMLQSKPEATELLAMAKEPIWFEDFPSIVESTLQLVYLNLSNNSVATFIAHIQAHAMDFIEENPKLLLDQSLREFLSREKLMALLEHHAEMLCSLDPGILVDQELWSKSTYILQSQVNLVPLIYSVDRDYSAITQSIKNQIYDIDPVARAKHSNSTDPLCDRISLEMKGYHAYRWYGAELERIAHRMKSSSAFDTSVTFSQLPQSFVSLADRIAVLETSPIVTFFAEDLAELDLATRREIEEWCLVAALNNLDPSYEQLYSMSLDDAVEQVKNNFLERAALVWPNVTSLDLSTLPTGMWNDLLLYTRLLYSEGIEFLDSFQEMLSSLTYENFQLWRTGISNHLSDEAVSQALTQLKTSGRIPETLSPAQYREWCREINPTVSDELGDKTSTNLRNILEQAVEDGAFTKADISESKESLIRNYNSIVDPLKVLLQKKKHLSEDSSLSAEDRRARWEVLSLKIHAHSSNHEFRLQQIRARTYLKAIATTPQNILQAGNILANGSVVSQDTVIRSLRQHFREPEQNSVIDKIAEVLGASRSQRTLRASNGTFLLNGVDTIEPSLLLSVGQVPVTTCQNLRKRDVNALGLLSTFVEPANRVVWAFDARNQPVARCITRLMKDKSGAAVIFVEGAYQLNDAEELIHTLLATIATKAQAMGVTVYASESEYTPWFSKELPTTLTSVESIMPGVHSDAAGGYISHSQFEIEYAHLLDLREFQDDIVNAENIVIPKNNVT